MDQRRDQVRIIIAEGHVLDRGEFLTKILL